ncbi:MAG: mechanosensitive ion channel family protein [Candidatus Mcinerneyibacterium aminivorans]|uniref:Mechanosensitive ion channel family protein n=1 Tax=Candidatus Mcinerneyibacterium aminivorans TaxID=2703815 RepID=A0A5D0MLI4_9BACT|nr:MAG: mechanosensitive ion channel family protein [Candidatus Mcinerneyibacterium aminivorans]
MEKLLANQYFLIGFKSLIVIIAGSILVKIISLMAGKILKKKLSSQTHILIKKFIFYIGWVIIIMTVLNIVGVKISVVLGAAGIMGIAFGFAAQTSVANIISGLFLISEKSFSIGDVIQIGDTVGVVDSVDLLSIKLKKFNNQYVRIPNENFIKSEVINITKYPIRRLDLNLGVAYKEDPEKVRDILFEIAKNNEYVLDNPEPNFIFTDFGKSSLKIFFGVWFQKQDYIATKNSIMFQIKRRLNEENIEIPFPHITVYRGEESKPFQFQKVNKN